MKMSVRLRIALVVSVLILALPLISHGQASDWKQIQAPPLHPFRPAAPKRIQLQNGLVIFILEDHELPLIRIGIVFHGGSVSEPGSKVGLVRLFGEAWRTGGTKNSTGDELDDYLEARAARVESNSTEDATSLSLDCLKENFNDVFRVFLELLYEPEFREDKVALAKNLLASEISRRNDDAFKLGAREGSKLVYGGNSPYARSPEYATVASVTRDDLLNWHSQLIRPNNAIVQVLGDFDANEMEAKLRGALGSWHRGPQVRRPRLQFHYPEPGIYLIQKHDVSTSTIQLVGLGASMDSPDYYAVQVFNQFFSGSISSRLFSNIRSKKGLAYVVGGGIGTEFDHPGLINLFVRTKSHTTAAAIDAFHRELEGLRTNPITSEELRQAKEVILNSFVFRFDSSEKVLQARSDYEFFGYPQDFLEKYPSGIAKITKDDIARVAQKYIREDELILLVVGNAPDFERPLSSFGRVITIDISIPPASDAAKAPVRSELDAPSRRAVVW